MAAQTGSLGLEREQELELALELASERELASELELAPERELELELVLALELVLEMERTPELEREQHLLPQEEEYQLWQDLVAQAAEPPAEWVMTVPQALLPVQSQI